MLLRQIFLGLRLLRVARAVRRLSDYTKGYADGRKSVKKDKGK